MGAKAKTARARRERDARMAEWRAEEARREAREEERRNRLLDLAERLVAGYEVNARAMRRLTRSADKLIALVAKKAGKR